jgi:hypothetical protein
VIFCLFGQIWTYQPTYADSENGNPCGEHEPMSDTEFGEAQDGDQRCPQEDANVMTVRKNAVGGKKYGARADRKNAEASDGGRWPPIIPFVAGLALGIFACILASHR